MKKGEWISGLLVTMVLFSCLAIPLQAPAATPAVKVVELSGAATAAIPITVPPGRAGLQPKLNLTYHSYKKNGWIGVGWDLSMGAITRSTKRGVDYTSFEFVANGQELVPIDIDPSTGNGTYQARIEGAFALYEFNHDTGWVMTAKDGTKYYLGQNPASRQDHPNDSELVFKWCLDKVVDPNGNSITVNYEKDQGQIYLDQIDYNDNEGSSIPNPSKSILFHLEDGRQDQTELFNPSFKVVTTKRLKTIEIQSESGLVRAYELQYIASSDNSRSLLSSVQQYGSDALINQDGLVENGKALPATQINWPQDQGGFNQTPAYTDVEGSGWTAEFYPRIFRDVNGDGMADLVLIPTSEAITRTCLSSFSPIQVSSITSSSGALISLEYTPSSQYQNKLLPFILQTASKITVNDGNEVVSETNYSYAGGLFDYETREFRGFKEAIQTNPDGSTKRTVFYQGDLEDDDPEEQGDQEDKYALKGKINYEEARESADQSTDASLIGRTEFTWATRDETAASGYERQFAFLDEKVIRSYENGQRFLRVHEKNTGFDAWGNLLGTRTWDEEATAEPITNTFDYNNLGSDSDPRWRKTMDKMEGDVSGPMRQVLYRYTSDGKANLEEKEHWNDQGANPVFRFEYYANGNIHKEFDAKNQLIAEYTYDAATETLQEQVKNALGHTLNRTYDQRYGAIITETDANGNITTNHYEAFGRVERVDLPNGGQSIIERHEESFPRWVKKRVLESDDPVSYIDTWEYFDGLGRTIQTVSLGEGGDKQIVTRTFYDTMGRQKEVFGPFFVAGTAEGVLHDVPASDVPWTSTDYDLRGRVTATHALDGVHGTIISTVSYNGLSSKVTDADEAQKTTIKDYLGRVREVIEQTETADLHTYYTYNAAGDLTHVRDVANNLTTIGYDTLGRKLTMTDPDMGSWQYQYDANGNLTWQKDANLKEIELQYDVLDRITAKNYLTPTAYDHNVAYTYDDGTITLSNHLGQLSKVTNGVVTTTYNGYDANGQLLSVSKTISGDEIRTTAFTFDLSGKPLSTIYPDSYQLNHHYYAGTGLLQSVVGITDMTNYVTYQDYPATGQIKKAVYGNNTETTYTRDPFSTRLTAILTKDAAGAAIMERSYGYTRAGDIKDISDNVKGISYFYGYDKLHLLTGETNSGTEDASAYAYNNMGSFTTKSKGSVVMSYSYDTAHVHAVRTVTVAGATHTFTYDANGNMTAGPDLTDPANVATRTIAYNSDNMPAQINHSVHGVASFTYDGDGTRAKKSGPNATTYYYGALFEKQAGELVKYIFAGSQRVAMVKSSVVKYFHQDHLGSATVVTDACGVKVEETAYLPFGGQRDGFTEQEKDPETGLYNADARLYDPTLGMFVSAYTMVPYPYNSQSFNIYSYCRNNPLRYTDPNDIFDPGETDPRTIDTDCDGLTDEQEDTNLNGVVDAGETDPRNSDTDGDAMTDGWEAQYSLNPLADDAADDADSDGFTNLQEFQIGTDPNFASDDHDGDGLPDWWEVQFFGLDLSNHATGDYDSDGLTNYQEYRLGLDPTDGVVDSDGDQLPDWWEVQYFGLDLSHTGDADDDGNGLTNYDEYMLGLDPTDGVVDSDGDGLPDVWEVKYFGHDLGHGPGDDNDGDGVTNHIEYQLNSNPAVDDLPGSGITILYDEYGRIKSIYRIPH